MAALAHAELQKWSTSRLGLPLHIMHIDIFLPLAIVDLDNIIFRNYSISMANLIRFFWYLRIVNFAKIACLISISIYHDTSRFEAAFLQTRRIFWHLLKPSSLTCRGNRWVNRDSPRILHQRNCNKWFQAIIWLQCWNSSGVLINVVNWGAIWVLHRF